jgi:hypothetical protein
MHLSTVIKVSTEPDTRMLRLRSLFADYKAQGIPVSGILHLDECGVLTAHLGGGGSQRHSGDILISIRVS